MISLLWLLVSCSGFMPASFLTPTKTTTCPMLESQTSGLLNISGRMVGDTVYITCPAGYWYNGSNPRVCQENGTWSGVNGQCQGTACQDFRHLDHGRLLPTSDSPDKPKYTVLCDPGYSHTGLQEITCTDTDWQNISCTEKAKVFCPDLEVDSLVRIDYEKFAPEMTIQLSCEKGYEFLGTENVTCQRDGKWSTIVAHCTAKKCGQQPLVENATFTGLGNSYMDRVTIKCDHGYRLKGSKEITCQDDGNWSKPGQCIQKIVCKRTDLPGDVRVELSDSNQVMHLSCEKGYVLRGRNNATCQEDGTWTTINATCEEVQCPALPAIRFGSLHTRGQNYTSVGYLQCDEGYEVDGSRTATCQATGEWSQLGKCKEKPKSHAALIVGLSIFITVFLVSLAAVLIVRRKRGIRRVANIPPDPLDVLNNTNRSTVEELLIEAARVKVHYVLGQEIQGHFWLVYFGGLRKRADSEDEEKVVLITLKGGRNSYEEMNDFIEKATNMRGLDHPNILQLLGITVVKNQLYVVLPHMEVGDLKNFVQSNPYDRDLYIKLFLDAAKGMEYLAERNFVHRDVAARNCMLDSKLKVYISDIGLAKDLHAEDYYTTDNMTKSIPLRWMAPESLEFGHYTTQTDVWAFGVLMWEVSAKGARPYDDVRDADLFKYLKAGNRLSKPLRCPMALYTLAYECWSCEPGSRPTFSTLVTRLEYMKTNIHDLEPITERHFSRGGRAMIDNVLDEEMVEYFNLKL